MTANVYMNNVTVLMGNGDGTLGQPTNFVAGRGPAPSFVASGDLNGDGTPDLVTANSGLYGPIQGNTISVLLGDSQGGFGSATSLVTGAVPTCVAIGDLNGDSKLDIVVTNNGANSVSVLLNRGSVPVEVQDLEATAGEAGIQLRWTLSSDAIQSVAGVQVQRAEAAMGPYALLTPASLAPSQVMSFEDRGAEMNHEHWYRILLLSRDGSTAASGSQQFHPKSPTTTLQQPFEPSGGGPVRILYSIGPSTSTVRLAIYDIRGRRVRLLDQMVRKPGEYDQPWDRRDQWGSGVRRGVYFVSLISGADTKCRKLFLAHPDP